MARPQAQWPGAEGGLSPFAANPAASRGRLHDEPESPTRTAFQRDRDRIIHCNAFRRLKHKTQVFVYHEGDYYRTRLTHSLEVSQIARSIGRVLGLDEDLCEALALAHDLGHPPFGHAGEDALNECLAATGGFDHNAQTLKIVTALEHRYAAFDGLNLTWETLEGLVKHNGPLPPALPAPIAAFNARFDLALAQWPSLEAQVAAISDDIAYNNHDIDDGLRAQLFTVDMLIALPFVGPIFRDVMDSHPGLERGRLINECVRRIMTAMIHDVIAETTRRLAQAGVSSIADIRAHGGQLAGFSAEMAAHDAALKAFLFKHMYRNFRVNRTVSKAKRLVRDLFAVFVNEPALLPPEWAAGCGAPDSPDTAHRVGDFIAGMTDRFAIEEHRRLFALETRS
ncbi:MAG: deoxyguanosinetriphosphate triphosphohydrolase [Alphaproteobacteria bacterium]|nr:deoxyguanosinetriphosphate triphosphohydrolase [Alphaproteobacteria bacterium]